MSGPLLLSIAAIGVGWAWIHRNGDGDNTPPTTVAVNFAHPDDATVATEVAQATAGAAAVKAAIDCESKATTIGDIPIEGSDGGQVLPVSFVAPEGGLVIDNTKSTGGADPSTQETSLHTNTPVDAKPPMYSGNTLDVAIAAKYG